jgi:hypothetical protein
MALALDLEAQRIAALLSGQAENWRQRFDAASFERLVAVLAKYSVLPASI